MKGKLYDVLLTVNSDLAELTSEIETLIFSSPRAAMQMTRTMAETLARHVAEIEEIEEKELSFADLLTKLKSEGILTAAADQAFYFVRKNGNVASHDGTRKMLIREALTCWESQHIILTWYIESYASPDIKVPSYNEPVPEQKKDKIEIIMAHIQELMGRFGKKKNAKKSADKPTGPIREIRYRDRSTAIPLFLRDAFLLPQRFPKSTTFLIRLNGEQQARLMSELPYQLDGLHKHVKRFKEENDEKFFEELCQFIQEEIARKELTELYAGETLLFYKDDYIILTEMLGNIELTKEHFTGQASLLKALHANGFEKVADLPKELVLLGKYPNVGEIALANLFNQLKVKSLEFSSAVNV